jgi:hypothetical protein
MPGDNAVTVAPGAAVQFPQDGPSVGATFFRLDASSFVLPAIGTYRVDFQVSVDEAGQLGLMLNGTFLPYTVVGRATGTSQLVGESLVTTSTINNVLELINPPSESTALTITPLAGGVEPVSASLTITQVG